MGFGTQRKITLIVGNSNAGKDYVAKSLFPQRTVFKMAAAGKRLFEAIYDLKHLAMDDKVYRLNVVGATRETYLDRFIYWFDNQDKIFPPNYFLNSAMHDLAELCQPCNTEDVCITDGRSPEELAALIAWCEAFGVHLSMLHVTSVFETPLKSDRFLSENVALFCSLYPSRYKLMQNHLEVQGTNSP